jgi:hypothetical protein
MPRKEVVMQAQLQLGLPPATGASDEAALRRAWARSGLPLPYHVALQERSLAICLRCLADAMRKSADGAYSKSPRRRR